MRVEATGGLEFPAVTLDGLDKSVTASRRPQFLLTFPDSNQGFQLTLQSSALIASSGSLPSSSLMFTARGGLVTALGQAQGAPRETGARGSLERSLRVLSGLPGTRGRWQYLPNPASFSLLVPADTYAGTYRGTLTTTLLIGP